MYGRSLLAGMSLLAAIGCGGGDSDSGTPSGPTGESGANTVTVGTNFFAPADLSVPTGTAVTWVWAEGAESHNVTFDDGGASSPTQSSGDFRRTFTGAGTFAYHCTIHGASVMRGTVTVSAAGTGGETTGGDTTGTGGSGMGGGGTGGDGYDGYQGRP